MIDWKYKAPPTDPKSLPRYLEQTFRTLLSALQKGQSYGQPMLRNANSVVNRTKYAGLQVWDMTNERPVYATGSLPNDVWKFADGKVAHSPK